jgi:hypothetical protein
MDLPNELDARHGDLVINRTPVPATVLPLLKRATAPIILAGHDSAPHRIDDFAAVEYAEVDGTQWLRLARDVELSHLGRHTAITMLAGDNEVYPLTEMNGEMARAVID